MASPGIYGKSGIVPVIGIVDGWGRTRTGTKGFRCGKARILALAPAVTLQITGVWQQQAGQIGASYEFRYPGYPGFYGYSGGEIFAGRWMTGFREWLRRGFPGAQVYASPQETLAAHPTGKMMPDAGR